MKKLLICYVHGFNSAFSPENDKVKALKAAFSNADVVGLKYDLEIDDFVGQLRKDLNTKLESDLYDSVLLVGSSLGGFLADHLAKTTGYSAVLINPSIRPDVTLLKELGPKVNLTNAKNWNFTRHALYELKGLAEAYYPFEKPALRLVLLDKGDELLDYELAVWHYKADAKVVVFEGGNHRFAHINEAMPEIVKLANTVVDAHPCLSKK